MKTKFILIAVILMLAGGVLLLLPQMQGLPRTDSKDSRVDGEDPATVSGRVFSEGGPNANPANSPASLPPNDLVTEAMQSGDEEQVLTACFAQYKETNPESATRSRFLPPVLRSIRKLIRRRWGLLRFPGPCFVIR